MAQSYLIDTCIWRDFYEDRISKAGNPLGKYATNLFMKIIKHKNQIIFSEALVWELKKDYDENEVNDMLNLLFINKVLVKIEITNREYLEAKRLVQERNLPFVDCLNAIQARNHNAVLVSRDEHFTKFLSDIAKIVKPEQIS